MARVLYVSQGYCTHDRRFLDRLAEFHEMWLLSCERVSVQAGVPLPDAEIQFLPPLSEGKLSPENTKAWAGAAERFRQIIGEISPEIVHAGPIPLGGYLAALADFHPAVMMSWGSDVLSLPDESTSAKKIVQFSLEHCDMAIADCEAVRERMMDLGNLPSERIVCLPWGVDLKVFRPKRSSLGIRQRLGWADCKVIISTRALEAAYSPFVLLKAIQRVTAERRDVRALILGDGSLKDEAESFIESNGLREKVYLCGQVPESALADYFAESDLYVSATKCDGSSISLLQAMACGLPAIVADACGNREWITDGYNGRLFSAGNDQALAEAIGKALTDGRARRIASQRNIRIARERADWERNFPRVLAAYEQVLAESHGREMEDNAQFQNR